MILILLDIDRTLVHAVSNYRLNSEWCNYFETFNYENYTIFKRPHLTTFLDTLFYHLSDEYKMNIQIGLFTAGSQHYTNHIIENIFKDYPLNRNYVFSDYHSNQSWLFDYKPKSLDYIKKILSTNEDKNENKNTNNTNKNTVDQIYLIDDSVGVKKYLSDYECYLIPKFYVCTDDFQPVFVKYMKNDTRLLECLNYLRNHLNNNFKSELKSELKDK